MASLVRRIQRRVEAKINDADETREPYRITQRVKGLTHRQAQRGMKEGPKQ